MLSVQLDTADAVITVITDAVMTDLGNQSPI